MLRTGGLVSLGGFFGSVAVFIGVSVPDHSVAIRRMRGVFGEVLERVLRCSVRFAVGEKKGILTA